MNSVWIEDNRIMDNLRGLLGERYINKILNDWFRNWYEVKNRVDERIAESVP